MEAMGGLADWTPGARRPVERISRTERAQFRASIAPGASSSASTSIATMPPSPLTKAQRTRLPAAGVAPRARNGATGRGRLSGPARGVAQLVVEHPPGSAPSASSRATRRSIRSTSRAVGRRRPRCRPSAGPARGRTARSAGLCQIRPAMRATSAAARRTRGRRLGEGSQDDAAAGSAAAPIRGAMHGLAEARRLSSPGGEPAAPLSPAASAASTPAAPAAPTVERRFTCGSLRPGPAASSAATPRPAATTTARAALLTARWR